MGHFRGYDIYYGGYILGSVVHLACIGSLCIRTNHEVSVRMA